MNKILVIRYGTIGDTIFASAFYRELRNALPNAQIDILADTITASIMQNNPNINNMIPIQGKFKNFFKYIKLFKNYDTVFFLKNDNFFSKIAFLARVKNRIGFDVKRNFALTTKIPYNNDKHEIDFYLDLLKSVNIPVNDINTEIFFNKNLLSQMKEYLPKTNKKRVLIQAFSRFSQKNWITDYWVETINYLKNTLSYEVILAGGNGDKENYNLILEKLETKDNIINLCGKLSIPESMCLINYVDLFIGIDSGLIHAAAALNKPSILLNGPTSLIRWTPRNNKCIVLSEHFECSPCCFASSKHKYCKGTESKCMRAIKPQNVIEKINTIITK